MKPRLVIHIGTHKTGSSTIQIALHANRDSLRDAGVLVPDTSRGPEPHLHKHGSVFRAAISRDGALAELERKTLLEEFARSDAHTMLISAEGLCEPVPGIPGFFAPLSAQFDIEVVCLLRRPDRFLESLYNQLVRSDVRREFRSILEASRLPVVRARMDYLSMLVAWKQLDAKMRVVAFDTAVRQDGLLPSFARAAGLPALVASGVHENRSVDMRLAVVLAGLNRLNVRYRRGPLINAANQIGDALGFPPSRHLLGREARAGLLAEMAPMMAELERMYGVRFDDDLPEDEPSGTTNSIDQRYLLELLARMSTTRARPQSASVDMLLLSEPSVTSEEATILAD
jgi:hypothetical protein